MDSPEFEIQALNFSCYGASLVHIDKNGKPLTPLYNYLKSITQSYILQSFHEKYGNPLAIAQATASPPLKMLNSGLQLYWLKYTRPNIFKHIKWSLHFPQYLSYTMTGKVSSEFTSIGCHTSLWDFEKKDYHEWVYSEQIHYILPPIVPTSTFFVHHSIPKITVGVGIHDSSAALLPYLHENKEPFLLLSTGTWSIALNPFTTELLSVEDLQNDSLSYLKIDGKPVRAARLFLGNEYKNQVTLLSKHYKTPSDEHQNIRFSEKIFLQLNQDFKRYFDFQSITLDREALGGLEFTHFPNFEMAYHQLMLELVELQIQVIYRAIGKSKIQTIYIDGGFVNNDVFIQMLRHHFTSKKIIPTKTPLGAAKGAALLF